MSSKTKIVVFHMKEIILYSPVHLSRHFAGGTAYIYVPPEKQRNFLIKEHFLSTGHLHFTAYFGR